MSISGRSNAESQRESISIVIPCFNEEDILPRTYRRLLSILEKLPLNEFELIFVDDGSRDRTLDILRGCQAENRRVRVIALARNFGHQMAVTAGIEHASGDGVVIIDADLQDPPEVIGEMIQRWRQGADVAYGVRAEREGETAFKRFTAMAFYRSLNRISDIPIPLDTGDFRLMDRAVVDALIAMPERDRFVRGMVAWLGFRQEAVVYKRAARLAGQTKYPLKKMVCFALDAVFSFSFVPLRLAMWVGFAAAGVAVLGLVYALLMRILTDSWVPGWTLLFIACLSIGSIQLVSLGVLGEYVGRTYGEVKRRPLYVVREQLGFGSVSRPSYARERKVSS